MKTPKKVLTKEPGFWDKLRNKMAERKKVGAKAKQAALEERARAEMAKLRQIEATSVGKAAARAEAQRAQQRLNAMAEKAATKLPQFIAACKAKGLDPKETFLLYYPKLANDAGFVRREFEARMNAAQDKTGKKGFSETVFYANEIRRRGLKA